VQQRRDLAIGFAAAVYPLDAELAVLAVVGTGGS
jgi:hypothetical protein